MPLKIDRTLLAAVILLVGVFALFEVTDLDLWAQDHFYDFDRNCWLVDSQAFWPRLLFYQGAKYSIVVFVAGLLLLGCLPERHFVWIFRRTVRRRDLLVVVLTLALSSGLIGLSKATTGVHFPDQIRRYGGQVAYVKVLGSFPADDRPAKRGKGFPAGHASAGFALLSLAGLARTRRGQWLGIAVGAGLGSAMGIYQNLKGAHYVSHTLITALVCWIIFLLWRRWLRVRPQDCA